MYRATKQTKWLQVAPTQPTGLCICLRRRENNYNNSKQLRGQTTGGIDRSQPGHEVEDIREWDGGINWAILKKSCQISGSPTHKKTNAPRTHKAALMATPSGRRLTPLFVIFCKGAAAQASCLQMFLSNNQQCSSSNETFLLKQAGGGSNSH